MSDLAAAEEDVISWLTELSKLKGQICMFTSWKPIYLSSMCRIDAESPSEETVGFTSNTDIITALGQALRDAKYERWLNRVLLQHRALVDQLTPVLESKLDLLGYRSEDVKGLSMPEKLVFLAEAELPIDFRALNAQKVVVQLVTAAYAGCKTKTIQSLFFRRDDSFNTFQGILRDLTAESAIALGRGEGYTLKDGPWIFRLLDKNNAFIPGISKMRISEECDYRGMVDQLLDEQTPAAAVWHVSVYSQNA